MLTTQKTQTKIRNRQRNKIHGDSVIPVSIMVISRVYTSSVDCVANARRGGGVVSNYK